MGFREVSGREWKPRDKPYVFASAIIEDVFGVPVREIVLILHGGDCNDAPRCLDLDDSMMEEFANK